jgi:hypothetical protein
VSTANVVAALGLINELLAVAARAGTVMVVAADAVKRAQNDGRDITDAELSELRAKTVLVAAALNDEIERRRDH